jgi:hypothetical protein
MFSVGFFVQCDCRGRTSFLAISQKNNLFINISDLGKLGRNGQGFYKLSFSFLITAMSSPSR